MPSILCSKIFYSRYQLSCFCRVFPIICSAKNHMQLPIFSGVIAMGLGISYTEVTEIGRRYFTIKAETETVSQLNTCLSYKCSKDLT